MSSDSAIRQALGKSGPIVKGMFGAILGGLILLGGLHIYQDHQALHQLITFINAHGAQIAALK